MSRFFTFRTVAAAFLTYIVVVVGLQSVFRSKMGWAAPEPQPPQACRGTAITVDYPFEGGFLDPHACKAQCDDQIQRYVLYSNGRATQCETLPGCNDWGEDNGVTCEPPVTDTPTSVAAGTGATEE